jgi:hypothetical protein
LTSNLTPPSRAELFCASPSAFQSAEPSECHRVWILASLSHAPEKARRLPRNFPNEIKVSDVEQRGRA